jgi:hypothetical protein
MTPNHFCVSSAVLCYIVGLFCLFNSETIVAVGFIFLMLWLLHTGAIADLSMRIKKIEDYLTQYSDFRGDNEHPNINGEGRALSG